MGLCRAETVGIVKKNEATEGGQGLIGGGIHELAVVTREENISPAWARPGNIISGNNEHTHTRATLLLQLFRLIQNFI